MPHKLHENGTFTCTQFPDGVRRTITLSKVDTSIVGTIPFEGYYVKTINNVVDFVSQVTGRYRADLGTVVIGRMDLGKIFVFDGTLTGDGSATIGADLVLTDVRGDDDHSPANYVYDPNDPPEDPVGD